MICRLARLAWLILLFPATPHAAEPVRVFAAVTLKPVLDMIAEEYRRSSGGDVLLVYGPSPALAKQIKNGAAADLFFSADSHPAGPVAVTAESRNADARSFLAYLRSRRALTLLKERGYVVLGQSE
jgi:ABC-type molybdate transport system substrate-binding protein